MNGHGAVQVHSKALEGHNSVEDWLDKDHAYARFWEAGLDGVDNLYDSSLNLRI